MRSFVIKHKNDSVIFGLGLGLCLLYYWIELGKLHEIPEGTADKVQDLLWRERVKVDLVTGIYNLVI